LYTFFTLYVIEDLLKRMSHDQWLINEDSEGS
jgi:hypothetical protein